MRLGGQILSEFCNINGFSYTEAYEYAAGTNDRIYLQLVDLNRQFCADTDGSCYLRYMPPVGSTLTVTIASVDSDRTVQKPATQVSGDSSLWYIDILPTDNIDSANVHLKLDEPGSIVRKGVIIEGIKVNPVDPGSISFC